MTITRRWLAWQWTVGLLAVVILAGCAPRARVRPVKMGDVDTGAGSVEATRRQLEGTWELFRLEAIDASGNARPVKASGRLQYDAYGNMQVKGVIEDPALKNALVLDTEGRIVIDPVKKQFHAADVGETDPRLKAIAPDKVRTYELTPSEFVVTYQDANGKPTARAVWHRAAAGSSSSES
jgi:hypothetical protein